MHSVLVEMLRRNAEHAEAFESRFDGLVDAQHPEAVTVCCSDSRVLGDHLWGNDEPGRLFSSANIGNRVVERTDAGEVVSGDVLYPLEHTGTRAAVVVGHTGCGAVTAAYDALTGDVSEPPGIERCLALLEPHLAPGVDRLPDGLDRREAVNRLVEFNVDRQVEFLVESDEVPAGTEVLGVVYDFQDAYPGRRGEVHVINVDGEADVGTLRREHPEIADRIDRIWTY